MYLAHRAEDGREQSILEHGRNVAKLCAGFAAPFGAEKLAGLLHDIGKYSGAFQRRIRGENIQVDHATAGAGECFQLRQAAAAFCIAGHHGRLPELGTSDDGPELPSLCGRMNRAKQGRLEPYGAWQGEITPPEAPPRMPSDPLDDFFFIRMLYSCLVDADHLDTEWFMQGKVERGGGLDMAALDQCFQQKIQKWFPPKGALNERRCTILERCTDQGERQPPGLFTLTVPTGGGKTTASLAFALRHAKTHGLKRVVYVIPYTSIIEQTADTFRKVLGDDAVLEHHSNVDFGDDESGSPDPEKTRKKLAAENWDLPVVVTTAVQFFESLFANRPSRCRKLHNLADSVIIFDEAQTIPLPYLLPCVRAIAELTVNYGASCVLCTATQPALGPMFTDIAPELALREIAPEIPAQVFQRVRYEHLGQLSDEALAQRLGGHEQALCIVSTRKQAQAVYDLLDPADSFHLSTLMTPEHRREVLAEIRRRLDPRHPRPCRVVSTSLIEAGVDVDFPAVYRAEAGLDSIVQAAGRCNREGKRPLDESRVYIFQPDSKYIATLPYSILRPIDVMHSVIRDCPALDAPEAIERYFTGLHLFTGEGLDSKQIVSLFEAGMQDPYHPSFPFAEAAQAFHLIDRNTRAVLIPRTEEARALAARLRRGERSRALLRKAGQFSVNVYEDHFDALNAKGALDILEPDLAVLTDPSLYSETTGLELLADDGVGIFL